MSGNGRVEFFEKSSDEEDTLLEKSSDRHVIMHPGIPLLGKELKDKYYLVYFTFYLIGVGTMLPFRFFSTANTYWMFKFRNVTDPDDLTSLQVQFTAYLTVACVVPILVFSVINFVISHWISFHVRLLWGFGIFVILFLLTTILVNVNTDTRQNAFFLVTVLSTVVLNAASFVMICSMYSIVSNFSSKYVTAFTGGQSLAAVFAAIAEIVSLALAPTAQRSALIYFLIADATILISLVLYVALSSNRYYKYHMYEERLMNGNEALRRSVNYFDVVNRVKFSLIGLFLTFAVTYSVYPAVTVLVVSEAFQTGTSWNKIYFGPTANFLTFAVCEYLGKNSAVYFQLGRRGLGVFGLSILRVVFIPLFLYSNLQGKHYLPTIIHSDVVYMVLMAVFALSGGYGINMAMCNVCRIVRPYERETATNIYSIFLASGLVFGSSIAVGLVKIL